MNNEVKLPHLGEGIETVEMAYWHFNVGDLVNQGDDLCEVTTDKASFNVEATVSGVLKEQKFKEGQELNIGDTIATLERT